MERKPINITEKGRADFELLKRIVETGDQLAFAEVMKRHHNSLYFVVLKLVNHPEDAEDLTIEIFAKVYENIDKYNHQNAFSTWLYRMATNHSIDFLRKKKASTYSLDNQPSSEEGETYQIQIEDKSISIDQKMIINQKADMVKQAMARISPKYREILEHRYYDDLSYEEISERMELPIGTVKVHLNRAKSMLERILVTLKQTYKQDLDEIY